MSEKEQKWLSDILSRDFIAKVTDAAVSKADDWLSDQLLHDREGINPEWDAYFERVVACFIDRASKVLSEELTLGEDFNLLVETEVLPRLNYCDYIDRCKDMRSEIWEESAGIHDPEGLYGVSSEFTIK